MVPACHKPSRRYAGVIVTLRRREGGGGLMSEIYRLTNSHHETNEDQAEQCLDILSPLNSGQMACRTLVGYPGLQILPEGLSTKE